MLITSILRIVKSSAAALAISSTERTGKPSRYILFVSGLILTGPVEPKQLPIEFTHTTKNSLVSIGLFGPTMSSHHPVEGSSLEEEAWADGERPVKISMQLEESDESFPQVS